MVQTLYTNYRYRLGCHFSGTLSIIFVVCLFRITEDPHYSRGTYQEKYFLPSTYITYLSTFLLLFSIDLQSGRFTIWQWKIGKPVIWDIEVSINFWPLTRDPVIGYNICCTVTLLTVSQQQMTDRNNNSQIIQVLRYNIFIHDIMDLITLDESNYINLIYLSSSNYEPLIAFKQGCCVKQSGKT